MQREGGDTMNLPDFQSFLASIDQEAFAEAIDSQREIHIIQSEDISEKEAVLIRKTYERAVSDSFFLTQILLQKYHEWLQEAL